MILKENNAVRDYGCLMLFPSKEMVEKLAAINKRLLPDSILYIDRNDDSYGVEKEPHLTIKYGFSPDLTHKDLGQVLSDIKPFTINLTGISMFQNAKFDVVKYDVELNDTLRGLRQKCDSFPNEDSYKDYIPHITIGYVKKGTFPHINKKINIPVNIARAKYSNSSSGSNRNLFVNFDKKTAPLKEMDFLDQGFIKAKPV